VGRELVTGLIVLLQLLSREIEEIIMGLGYVSRYISTEDRLIIQYGRRTGNTE
jgi:hypothetical protein